MLNTHYKLANQLDLAPSTVNLSVIPLNLVNYANQQWHKQHAHEPFSKPIEHTAKNQICNFIKSIEQSIGQQARSACKQKRHEVLNHLNNIKKLIKHKNDGQIIIKKSDKSSKLTIMSKIEYTQKALEHLNDPQAYELVFEAISNKSQANAAPTTSKHSSSTSNLDLLAQKKQEIAQSVIEAFNIHIRAPLLRSKIKCKSQILHYIAPNSTLMKFPRIYFLPKTHKIGSPFRPIVSTINWLTENASILLDSVLQTELFSANRFPQLPRDTFSFLRALNKVKLEANSSNSLLLVTFDIASLYTSIPQQTASQRAFELLQSSANAQQISPRLIYNISQWILKFNYFEFQERIFHQKHGIAMGNVAGGALANTYLLSWESQFLTDTRFKQNLLCYQRYFDDGFLIWSGDEQTLNTFLAHMNSIDQNIKITHQASLNSIEYLDIEISFNSQLCEPCSSSSTATCASATCKKTTPFLTRSYRKPIAIDSYLSFKSAHPFHLRANLPHSILFRAFLTSSNLRTYIETKKRIYNFFLKSEYPIRVILRSFTNFEAKHALNNIVEPFAINSMRENTIFEAEYNKIRLNLLESTCKFKTKRKTTSAQSTETAKIYLPITYFPRIEFRELINDSTWSENLRDTHIAPLKPILAFKKPNSLLKLLSRASD